MDTGAHYLKPSGRTFTPACVIFADTETRQHTDQGQEIHTLRLWEAKRVFRRDRRYEGEADTKCGRTCGEFAAQVDKWATYPKSAWLYTHNVTFDLTVTNLAYELGELGWTLSSRFAVGGDSMWCVFHKGARKAMVTDNRPGHATRRERVEWDHTLTIADSASLFPGPLAQLGPLVGIEKLPLPDDDDSDETWAARCHGDVEILSAAVLELMDFWDDGQFGQWSVTGAGQAWQHYKSTLGPKQVVIDHDPAVLALERAAVYGGRRDVFRTGNLPPGRYAEVDFEAAHASIAANLPLPARAACPVGDQHRALALRGRVPAGMLAEVTINTDVPNWPVRIGGRVFYPVGRFRTTLAAPDIQAAADAHVLEAVHEGWLFTMTHHLRGWANTVLRWIRAGEGAVSGAVRVWAKLASRAVIGKFAQRGWRTEPCVGPPCQGWSVQHVSDMWTGNRGVYTGVNGDYYLSWADQRGEHERPAVLAFVEAYLRSRLGRIINGRFGRAIMQCDTDGVMVSHSVLEDLAAELGPKWVHNRQVPASADDVIGYWNERSQPLMMREKTQFARAVVYGPQHVVLDGKPRFAGIPKGAWPTGEHSWMARLWPGMTWQAQHAALGTYARPIQPYKVFGPYAQAWVLEDGSVRAAEAAIDAEGANHLIKWEQTRWAAVGLPLGAFQGRWADGLWEGGRSEETGTARGVDGQGQENGARGLVRCPSQDVPPVPPPDRESQPVL